MTREIVVVVRVSTQENSVCAVVYANFLKLFIKLNKKCNT